MYGKDSEKGGDQDGREREESQEGGEPGGRRAGGREGEKSRRKESRVEGVGGAKESRRENESPELQRTSSSWVPDKYFLEQFNFCSFDMKSFQKQIDLLVFVLKLSEKNLGAKFMI